MTVKPTDQRIPLWRALAQASEEQEFVSQQGDLMVRNVTAPSLTAVLPEPALANGTAVVVAPGGGFRTLSWDYEGTDIAQRLADRGIAAFVLRYRLVDTGRTHEDFLRHIANWLAEATKDGPPRARAGAIAPEVEELAADDAAHAVRYVRQHATEYGGFTRVGLLGFSAGAFVATAVAAGDDLSARPDFVAPIYGGGVLHPVPDDAPPLFAAVAADDSVCLDATLETFTAWRAARRPAELHVYERGEHGFGARTLGLPVDTWLERFFDWLATHPNGS